MFFCIAVETSKINTAIKFSLSHIQLTHFNRLFVIQNVAKYSVQDVLFYIYKAETKLLIQNKTH